MSLKPISIKLSEEPISRWEAIRISHGGTAQDVFMAIVSAYEQRDQGPATDSPFDAEDRRITRLLNEVKNVTMAHMTLAENDKLASLKEMAETVTEAQAEAATLKERLTEAVQAVATLTEKNEELGKAVATLTESAENTGELKNAWAAQQKNLEKQIISLNGEAQESRDLKGQLADIREVVAKKGDAIKNMEGALSMAEEKNKNKNDTIINLKAQVEDTNKKHDLVYDDYRKAHSDYKEATQKTESIMARAMDREVELSSQIQAKDLEIKNMREGAERLKANRKRAEAGGNKKKGDGKGATPRGLDKASDKKQDHVDE